METYFGKRYQYKDSEIDLALDLKILGKIDAIDLKVRQYLKLEELLKISDPCVWRELLDPYTEANENQEQILHSNFLLKREDVQRWFEVLCRKDPKKRTIVFYGPSNAGKSLIARALLYPVAPGYIQRDGGTNVHWLENIYRKSVILWEEPSIHMSNIEDVKLLLGGEEIAINRKNKPILTRTNPAAVIVTTNKAFWHYESQPLKNRIEIYNFNSKNINIVFSIKTIIKYICDVYDGRYE